MRRFFVKTELRAGETVRLSAGEAKHAVKVLRLQPGARVRVVNGAGREGEGELTAIDAEGGSVRLDSVNEKMRVAGVELVQAQLKGPKMDWLVEKITELGVDAMHVVQTGRTVAAGDRADRWQRIAQAALKQSGNATMPEINGPSLLAEALATLPEGARFWLDPRGQRPLAEAAQEAVKAGQPRVLLAIGPEGGFSAEEEAALEAHGFLRCTLSKQVLRGETAAIAACAIAAHAIDF